MPLTNLMWEEIFGDRRSEPAVQAPSARRASPRRRRSLSEEELRALELMNDTARVPEVIGDDEATMRDTLVFDPL